MKKIYLFLIICLLICTMGSCKGNKRELTLVCNGEEEVIVIKVGKTYLFEEKYLENHLFAGWFDEQGNKVESIEVSDDAIFTAKFIEYGTAWNITYELNGGRFTFNAPITYTTGKTLKIGDPMGEGDMEFLGWYLNDELIEKISENSYGDIILVAKWNDNNVYHSISYTVDEEVEMPSEILTKYIEGLEYYLPVPKKLGYFFRGWYKEQECINRLRKIDSTSNEELNLYPLWVKKTRKNAFVSFLGDSITTYEGIIPEGFPTYYPAGDVDSIDKTWWSIALKASMTNLLANNSYSGSYVSQGTMYGASEKRIELLSKDGIDPDVVVINMGTNDLTHNISLTKFTTMYKQMIENIKKMYDDVDIFVLNMPFNKYAMSFNEPREKMNESIKAIAEEYGLFYIDLVGLIDFNGAYEYMYAGAHPNAAGMEIIGKEVGKLLSREYKRYWIGEE